MIVSNRWLYQGADQKPHSNNISKHRDRTQAVSNQGDEVHPRLSGDPVSPWNRNQFERQSRPKNRSGVMITQFRHGDDRAEVRSRQNTEVPDMHADARQNAMQRFVDSIKGPKQNRFHSAAPFGKDRLRAALIREGADDLQGPSGVSSPSASITSTASHATV